MLHYVFATACNYWEWRNINAMKCSFHEFMHYPRNNFKMANECDKLPMLLRHQICALVMSLHKFPSSITETNDHSLNAPRISQRRTRSSSRTSRRKLFNYPDLASTYFQPKKVPEICKTLLNQFVKGHLLPLDKFFHPITPLNNPCRMNYQSDQAIRIFFGKTKSFVSKEHERRYVYGPLSVMNSTGSHPTRDYKVYPFPKELLQLTAEVERFINRRRVKWTRFNFVETKVYLGDDMFKTQSGSQIFDEKGMQLKLGKVKKVNLHNDLKFSDDGVQAESDTACGTEPTVTLTFGSSRTLTFERKVKRRDRRTWDNTDLESNVPWTLQHGSIFILEPNDEIPHLVSDTRHKTKHRIDFCGTGVSFALVFRCVKRCGTFDRNTNQWILNAEEQHTIDKVKEHIKKKNKMYETVHVDACRKEMALIGDNVCRWFAQLNANAFRECADIHSERHNVFHC